MFEEGRTEPGKREELKKMGKIRSVGPVKYFFGLIGREGPVEKARQLLDDRYGLEEENGPVWDFKDTDYYEKEMGTGLKRQFVACRGLKAAGELADLKVMSNELEGSMSGPRGRSINIDPGYLDAARIVLASTKDFAHRLYLGRGIFGEVTLMFKGKQFHPQEHTYPDYRSTEYLEYFRGLRQRFMGELKTTMAKDGK